MYLTRVGEGINVEGLNSAERKNDSKVKKYTNHKSWSILRGSTL